MPICVRGPGSVNAWHVSVAHDSLAALRLEDKLKGSEEVTGIHKEQYDVDDDDDVLLM